MPTHPLRHHEIITLVAPFTRQGYHPDLQATDRLERRLVFKPVERAFKTSSAGELSESLQLENRDGKNFGLTRHLTCVTPSDENSRRSLTSRGRTRRIF